MQSLPASTTGQATVRSHVTMLRTIARPETAVGDAILAGADALEQLDQLRKRLPELEWMTTPTGERGCPVPECGVIFMGLHPPRHAPDCWLALAAGLPHD